ncbi:MAG: hypothetical protein RI967_2641 [Planctomycetota bacterium]
MIGGFEWVLLAVATVAAALMLVAGGLALARLGVAAQLYLARLGRAAKGFFGDLARFLGGIVVAAVLVLVAGARLAALRGARAREAFRSALDEAGSAFTALGSALVRRPLEVIGLEGALGVVAERLPAALSDRPRTTRQGEPHAFDGYRVLRELPRGGSGARLFVAEPDDRTRRRIGLAEGAVAIKAFDFDDGTHLAEVLRESRSLESARRLGLVLDHAADERRFHYVMRYHEGVDLGRFTRGLHAAAGDEGANGGLDAERLLLVATLVREVVATLGEWHAQGLLHKDVKPENVIVHEGRATLVDLGLVTPIASTMTLTTHGTEYYRDPELVRQAMRGARVAEVDAARFDLYGAGALLYFVLEGTFPAHGVLSAFRRPSPPCLQWIARRAMAEFDQRYPDAGAMLADLDHALAGGDPAAVRPADLPSMRAQAERDREAEMSEERRFLAAGSAPTAPPPPPDAHGGEGRAPRVVVVNWWTGAYRVEGGATRPEAIPASSRSGLWTAVAVFVAAAVALAAVAAIWFAMGATLVATIAVHAPHAG